MNKNSLANAALIGTVGLPLIIGSSIPFAREQKEPITSQLVCIKKSEKEPDFPVVETDPANTSQVSTIAGSSYAIYVLAGTMTINGSALYSI